MSKKYVEISGLDYQDISNEKVRVYTFPGGDTVRIEGPKFINVSARKGHRIVAKDGSHYVQPGWIHMHWTVVPGEPQYDKSTELDADSVKN